MADAAEVTAIEIARLAGVGRAAVSNWRKRHDDFPPPVGGTTASPTFRLSDLEAWLRRQGKAAHLPAEELAWQQIRSISSEHELAPALVLVGELFRSMNSYASSEPRLRGVDALLAESDPVTIVTGMRKALRERTVLDVVDPGSIDDRHVILLRALADLVAERGAASAFDLLLGRMHEATRLPQVPDYVAELMVALLSVEPQRVYDPACGTGRLLMAAATRWPRALVHGDDANQALLNLAILRAAAHGTKSGMFRHCGLRDAPRKPIEADATGRATRSRTTRAGPTGSRPRWNPSWRGSSTLCPTCVPVVTRFCSCPQRSPPAHRAGASAPSCCAKARCAR